VRTWTVLICCCEHGGEPPSSVWCVEMI